MKESKRRFRKTENSRPELPVACAISLLIGLGTALLLLLIAAAIVYAQPDPAKLAQPASMAVLYISVAVSGAAAARLTAPSLPAIGICGGVFLLLTAVPALILGGVSAGALPLPAAVVAHAAIPLTAFGGGFLGKARPKKSASRAGKRRIRRH